MTLIGQKNIDMTKQPSLENGMMYGCSVGQNHKDSEFFVSFQFIVLNDDGTRHLYVTNNGSYEIKEFFKLAEEGKVDLPLKTKICVEGKSFYFEGFHTTSQEACELLCAKLGI